MFCWFVVFILEGIFFTQTNIWIHFPWIHLYGCSGLVFLKEFLRWTFFFLLSLYCYVFSVMIHFNAFEVNVMAVSKTKC